MLSISPTSYKKIINRLGILAIKKTQPQTNSLRKHICIFVIYYLCVDTEKSPQKNSKYKILKMLCFEIMCFQLEKSVKLNNPDILRKYDH
jgi:hypothetical protein